MYSPQMYHTYYNDAQTNHNICRQFLPYITDSDDITHHSV